MANNLVTNWVCVATAGPTVDGREIKDEWLSQMADSYDPSEYTAMIYVDHMRYATYGTVRALKTEVVKGIRKLFAKICPTSQLVRMNQMWQEKLFFSIEPDIDYKKTGKAYLTGLAMTDQPASTGTTEMHFSVIPGRGNVPRFCGEPLVDLRELEEAPAEAFIDKLARFFSKEQQDNDMTQEQFNQLTEAIGSIATKLEDVEKKVDGFQAKEHEVAAPAEAPAEVEGDATVELSPEFSASTETLEQMGAKLEAFGQKLEALSNKMEEEVPGTKFNENTGTDKNADLL